MSFAVDSEHTDVDYFAKSFQCEVLGRLLVHNELQSAVIKVTWAWN